MIIVLFSVAHEGIQTLVETFYKLYILYIIYYMIYICYMKHLKISLTL